MKSWLIAKVTFLEAVRDRFFHFVFLLSMGMVGGGTFFLKFDFGSTDFNFLVDFSFGTIGFFGILIAIILNAHLWFSEVQNRTVITTLARPVARWQYLIGKWGGCVLLLFFYTFLLSLIAYASISIWFISVYDADPKELMEIFTPYMAQTVVLWFKFILISSLVVWVCSIGTSMIFTVLVSLFLIIICQFQFAAESSYANAPFFPYGWLGIVINSIFPDFQSLDIPYVGTDAVENWQTHFFSSLGYAVIYSIGYILAAIFIFRRKELI